jgi:hypothetical protein
VVDVTDRPDVAVRLVPLELLFSHNEAPFSSSRTQARSAESRDPVPRFRTRLRTPA